MKRCADLGGYDPAAYGESCADYYDAIYPAIEPGQLAALRDLAGPGPALELGLATGRVSIPLAASGLDVHGIEASPAMLEQFRVKPGSAKVRVLAGDFSSATYDTRYRLIFSLVSTLHLLPTLDLQRSALKRVAAHLLRDGIFLTEGYGGCMQPAAERHEHSLCVAGAARTYRVTTLAPSTALQDSLAETAGLVLRARWSDWRRSPFTPANARHISLYGLADSASRSGSTNPALARGLASVSAW